MDEIKLQKGLPADAKAIRIEVFVDEQGFHEEFDGRDDRAYHAVLYRDGEYTTIDIEKLRADGAAACESLRK